MDEVAKLAYTAGIIDGDGSIGIACQNGVYRIVVQLSDKLGYMSSWLYERYGGWLGQFEQKSGMSKGKLFYKWSMTNNKAKEFVSSIAPYLIEKQSQAQIVIHFPTFQRGVKPSRAERIARQVMYERIKELNQA